MSSRARLVRVLTLTALSFLALRAAAAAADARGRAKGGEDPLASVCTLTAGYETGTIALDGDSDGVLSLMQVVVGLPPVIPICNPVTNSYAGITGPRVPCPVLGAAVCAGYCAINPTCATATWAAWSSWFPPPAGACYETCYCLP